MKLALIVGIDYYQHVNPLFGCVNDAKSVKGILDRNGDGTNNFDCVLWTAGGMTDAIKRAELKDKIEQSLLRSNFI